MQPAITIQLARSRSEFEAAFRLLQKSYEAWGQEPAGDEQKLWLLKQHALPSTNTIVALHNGKVVGAICLFGESPFHFPLEARHDLGAFREKTEGRLAELSLPAFHADFAPNEDLLFSLMHFAASFGADFCHCEGFVMEAPERWARQYAGALHFEKVESRNGSELLFLNAREGIGFHAHADPKKMPACIYPEKKFFHVTHQRMPVEVLNHLFNVRTTLFAQLNDFDLRVLKNIYDYGEYAKVLPHRGPAAPERKGPRHPRFPMNCEGYLVSDDGERLHVQLLDVSREGLKLCSPEGIDSDATYMLTLFIGVNRKSELIAKIVWADEATGIAGLELKSCDANWSQLLEYLEKDYSEIA